MLPFTLFSLPEKLPLTYISKTFIPPLRSYPDPTSSVNLLVTDFFPLKYSLLPPNFYHLYYLFCLMTLVGTLSLVSLWLQQDYSQSWLL